MTFSPRSLNTSQCKVTKPRSGLLREARVDSTLPRTVRLSPGRTGLSHFTSSMPGEPIEAASRGWQAGRREKNSVRRGPMFYIGDLFQWERFIAPSLVRLFFWLVVVIVILAGLSGLVSALGMMVFNPIAGAFTALASFAGMLAG